MLCMQYIFTFSKQSFNESLDFATDHSLMNYTTLIDSCQAQLPVQYALTSNSFSRNDTGIVIDYEPHLSCTCKASLLFVPLAVRVQAGCSAFPFNTPTKQLIRLYFKAAYSVTMNIFRKFLFSF